jgi:hypothetical protein
MLISAETEEHAIGERGVTSTYAIESSSKRSVPANVPLASHRPEERTVVVAEIGIETQGRNRNREPRGGPRIQQRVAHIMFLSVGSSAMENMLKRPPIHPACPHRIPTRRVLRS